MTTNSMKAVRSVHTTERDRAVGDLTASEVRQVLAEYLQA
jgi:hypothetical protein